MPVRRYRMRGAGVWAGAGTDTNPLAPVLIKRVRPEHGYRLVEDDGAGGLLVEVDATDEQIDDIAQQVPEAEPVE